MKNLHLLSKTFICCVLNFVMSINANATTINFSGQLGIVESDSGSGVYSGTPIGTGFSGFIDDGSLNGELTDGTTLTSFSCCISAGGISVSNNFVINADDALFLNTLAGSDLFNPGDVLDGINIEGDTALLGGGRIEIGLSYIFDSSVFDDISLNNYPFDPNNVLLGLFFITEESSADGIIYSAAGKLNPVPLPASIWLFSFGLISLVRFFKRRN